MHRDILLGVQIVAQFANDLIGEGSICKFVQPPEQVWDCQVGLLGLGLSGWSRVCPRRGGCQVIWVLELTTVTNMILCMQ